MDKSEKDEDETFVMQSQTSSSVVIQRYEEPALEWPCASCAKLLGVVHLFIGVALLLFDIATNEVSRSFLAISAAFVFIICAIFCFISTCRLDKAAQKLLLLFAFLSGAISTAMFLLSARQLNVFCVETKTCGEFSHVVHSQLVVLSLVEITVSIITMWVCIRSLSGAYAVPSPYSPYQTLIVGDYSTLVRQPQPVSTA